MRADFHARRVRRYRSREEDPRLIAEREARSPHRSGMRPIEGSAWRLAQLGWTVRRLGRARRGEVLVGADARGRWASTCAAVARRAIGGSAGALGGAARTDCRVAG